VRRLQLAGVVFLVLGLLILFFLRGPLYSLLVVVLNVIGILVGILMVIVGVALTLGGRAFGRRRPVTFGFFLAGEGARMDK
jgi:hypothetical protein